MGFWNYMYEPECLIGIETATLLVAAFSNI